MLTDWITNSRDRHRHAYTPRCQVKQKQGLRKSRSSKEDTISAAKEFPIRNKPFQDHPVLIIGPSGPPSKTIRSHHRTMSSQTFDYNDFKAFQDHCVSVQSRPKSMFLISNISRPLGLKKHWRNLLLHFKTFLSLCGYITFMKTNLLAHETNTQGRSPLTKQNRRTKSQVVNIGKSERSYKHFIKRH